MSNTCTHVTHYTCTHVTHTCTHVTHLVGESVGPPTLRGSIIEEFNTENWFEVRGWVVIEEFNKENRFDVRGWGVTLARI